MPRAARVHVHGGMYHTILRGNHRNAIFNAPEDRDEFADILGEALERFGSRVLAYCWMTNHVHAIVQVADRPLGRLVQLFASRYARRYQRRVPTTGHLFERRYRARLITDIDYLLQATRYIHLNPVEACIVTDPAEYSWSSHRHYLGAPAPRWLCVDEVLGKFGGSRREAIDAYLAYVGAPRRECPVGKWTDGARNKLADRETAPSFTEIFAPPKLGLEDLATEIAGRYGVTPAELRSPKRNRSLSAPRAALAQAAINSGAATLSETAAFLGRAPSTISWLVQRYHTPPDAPRR
jgi:putative transposase